MFADIVTALCGGLAACGRILPAAALLQFDSSQPAGAPAALLLRHAREGAGPPFAPGDLPFVECFWSAHTLEAVVCTVCDAHTPRAVLRCVEGQLAAAPMRELAAAQAADSRLGGGGALAALAMDGPCGRARTRGWCLLRTMRLLA